MRDYVFPLISTERDGDALRMVGLRGTGFLVGSRGVALTAAHVIGDGIGDLSALFLSSTGEWLAVGVQQAERHDREDIAALRLDEAQPWGRSFLALSSATEHQSCPYMLWGYPEDVAREVVIEGRVRHRPDLVYVEGYVRRRISNLDLPRIRGTGLFELSDPGGSGCSGAPVIKRGTGGGDWQVIGIYVGERSNDDGIFVGYAVRADCFRDWSPSWLSQALADEPQ